MHTLNNFIYSQWKYVSYQDSFFLLPHFYTQVYLVDYGLAYRYSSEENHKEYKEDPRRKHDGTVEFTSVDAHKGVREFFYRMC